MSNEIKQYKKERKEYEKNYYVGLKSKPKVKNTTAKFFKPEVGGRTIKRLISINQSMWYQDKEGNWKRRPYLGRSFNYNNSLASIAKRENRSLESKTRLIKKETN